MSSFIPADVQLHNCLQSLIPTLSNFVSFLRSGDNLDIHIEGKRMETSISLSDGRKKLSTSGKMTPVHALVSRLETMMEYYDAADKGVRITSAEAMMRYLRENDITVYPSFPMVFFISDDGTLIGHEIFEERADYTIRNIVKCAIESCADGVTVVERCLTDEADDLTAYDEEAFSLAKKIKNALDTVNIKLTDYIRFNKRGYFSFNDETPSAL